MSNIEILRQGIEDFGIEASDKMLADFQKYKEILVEWNQKMNLTGIEDEKEVFIKHFLDSVSAVTKGYIKNGMSLIDVGTGAGFPGMPLRICLPELKVTLLDSLNKRINFLNLVVRELGLKNVKTIHSRAEDGARKPELREKFDIATSRAVANMAVLSEFCMPYVKKGGYFVALKGPSIDEELENGSNAIKILGGELKDIIEISIEETDLKHNIVEVKKIKTCPKTYPRKAGTVNKKPLQ